MQSVRRRAAFLRGGCVIQIYCVPSLMTAVYHTRAGLRIPQNGTLDRFIFFYRRKPLDPADRAFAFDYHGCGELGPPGIIRARHGHDLDLEKQRWELRACVRAGLLQLIWEISNEFISAE